MWTTDKNKHISYGISGSVIPDVQYFTGIGKYHVLITTKDF